MVQGNRCNPSNDDNVTAGESITLSFGTTQTLSNLLFNQEGHMTFKNSVAAAKTLLFGTNGGGLTSYSFADLMNATFTNVLSATFAYGGRDAEQYYVASATANPSPIPLPAAAPLLLGALGMLGFGVRRRSRR